MHIVSKVTSFANRSIIAVITTIVIEFTFESRLRAISHVTRHENETRSRCNCTCTIHQRFIAVWKRIVLHSPVRVITGDHTVINFSYLLLPATW